MKSLVSILAIGLTLSSLPHSVKGVDPEETFTNLCGRTFVITVLAICEQFDREFLLPKKPSNVENSDNEDPFVAKAKRMYDNDGTQQFVLPYAQRPLNNDDNQNEQVPDNLNYQDSKTEEDSMTDSSLSSNFDVRKFNKTEISEQCCQSTCNVRQMRRLCFW